jgi:hypothetical protein
MLFAPCSLLLALHPAPCTLHPFQSLPGSTAPAPIPSRR